MVTQNWMELDKLLFKIHVLLMDLLIITLQYFSQCVDGQLIMKMVNYDGVQQVNPVKFILMLYDLLVSSILYYVFLQNILIFGVGAWVVVDVGVRVIET